MTPTPTTAAPDPVRVAREAADAVGVTPHSDMRPFVERAAEHAARAMQEAMSAPGGGEVACVLAEMCRVATGEYDGYGETLDPWTADNRADVDRWLGGLFGLLARPAPEVKDAAEGVDRWEAGFRNIAGMFVGARSEFDIPDIVERVRALTAPAPATASEGLVERLRGPLPTKPALDGRGEVLDLAEVERRMEEAADRIEAAAAEMERKDAALRCALVALEGFSSGSGVFEPVEVTARNVRAALRPEAKGGRDGE